MRISDWSSDVCSSDLRARAWRSREERPPGPISARVASVPGGDAAPEDDGFPAVGAARRGRRAFRRPARSHRAARTAQPPPRRSEEHTSELQSLMRISYAVFCLKKKNKQTFTITLIYTTQRSVYLNTTHT